MLPLIMAGASLLGSMYQSNKANKTAQAAANASQIDIDALDAKTRSIAQKNAFDSAALERQLTPEVPQLRSAANKGVLNDIQQGSPEERTASNFLTGRLGQPVAGRAMSPLLAQAIEKAKSNLNLGGRLDLDTRNEVTRRGLETAGSVGGGLGLGRDIVARDLGLTSLELANQRLGQATQLGGMEQGAEEFNVGTAFNNEANILNQLQLLRAMGDSRFGRNLAAAQYGQSIQQPVVGLDPGSVADVMSGNAQNKSAALSNQAAIQGQQGQNFMNMAGNLAGYGLLNYTRPQQVQPKASTPNYNPYPLLGTNQPGVSNKTVFGF